MRLSDWRAHAPMQDPVSPKVIRIVEAALTTIGATADPECWIVWGDDPKVRYALFAPTDSGLVQVNVRVSVPGEGPRAAAKVIRWSRVQVGELAVEIQGGHRLVTFQVESQVLSGVDDVGEGIATFARALFASIDGRAAPAPASVPRVAKPRSTAGKALATTTRTKKPPSDRGS